MKPTLSHEAKTLGDWAYLAIAKHFDKILKHEAEVLADKDPEELHQMRVGMRRLRSAIAGFSPALNLAKDANEKQVGKIARTLGTLRDIDVLEETLKTKYQPLLPEAEQKRLEEALDSLGKERKKAFKDVKNTLDDKIYLNLKQSFQAWLEQPSYQEIAEISIDSILPDLLLPQVSKLILHPGWIVGVKFDLGKANFPDKLSQKEVEELLNNQGTVLHGLRKEVKRSRYNMELFTHFYGDTYQNYINDVKAIQSVLGDIQDCFVLREFFDNIFESDLDQEMPTLAAQLREIQYQKWQEWSKLQRQFLNSKARKALHMAILKPTLIKTKTKALIAQ